MVIRCLAAAPCHFAADASRPLAVVVELHVPAPLTSVCRVPPILENADFAPGQDDGQTNVGWCRPAVLPLDGVAFANEQGHRENGTGANKLIAKAYLPAGTVPHFYPELGRGRMHQEAKGGIERGPREREPARARVRVPEVPRFHIGES